MTSMNTDEDPVTATYDVFITPALQEQIQLLQYLNRPRDRPYNDRFGARPENVRLKPKSGFLEVDIEMHTGINFNRYQSLKWGDAVQTAKQLHNDSATYGPASGFAVPRARPGHRAHLKDKVERDHQIANDLANFDAARKQDRALQSQTLGGKINRCGTQSEGAQPIYFVGAFRGEQLHLTKVDGTIQMRPQFHHMDAEDQRNRTAISRAAPPDPDKPAAPARAIQQSYKDLNDDKDKDAPERRMRKLLQDAEEEEWSGLLYVDEQEDLAYDTFNHCMFLNDDVQPLKSEWNPEQYLNEISPARHVSHRRKKRLKKKDTIEIDAADESQDDVD